METSVEYGGWRRERASDGCSGHLDSTGTCAHVVAVETPMASDLERVLEARRRLKERYPGLHEEMVEIIFKIDPMELNFETNTDEYTPEVDAILSRAEEAKSSAQFETIVREEFNRLFGSELDPPAHMDEVVAQLWKALCRCSNSP